MVKRAAEVPPWVSLDASSTPNGRPAAERGVEATAISLYGEPPGGRGCLLLGYAVEIRKGIRRLAAALEQASSKHQVSGFRHQGM